jgi:DNA-binding NarL/FixJ family response regulator
VDVRLSCRDAALRNLLAHLRPAGSHHPQRAGPPIVISDSPADCTPSTIVVVDPHKPGMVQWVSAAIRQDSLGGAVTIDRLERDLPAVLDAVSAGLLAFSPGLLTELDRAATLSRRQERILHLVALGLSNAAVAERLRISRSTVKREVSHLLVIFSCANRSQLVARAAEQGFLRSARPAAIRG